jgi:hypothetical protein
VLAEQVFDTTSYQVTVIGNKDSGHRRPPPLFKTAVTSDAQIL